MSVISKCFLNIKCEFHNFRTPAQLFDKFDVIIGVQKQHFSNGPRFPSANLEQYIFSNYFSFSPNENPSMTSLASERLSNYAKVRLGMTCRCERGSQRVNKMHLLMYSNLLKYFEKKEILKCMHFYSKTLWNK